MSRPEVEDALWQTYDRYMTDIGQVYDRYMAQPPSGLTHIKGSLIPLASSACLREAQAAQPPDRRFGKSAFWRHAVDIKVWAKL